ncbi:MAG TPA: ATP-binding cassette domain-containing protein [Burkholderiaceae bacterium]|nr:ATP-binding cassette domain-containing protein [Burkholderiaceae bacterium]HQR70565.1 ATP-binding cassette domain-containing protein [Burkholderiaceae bacterium]
MDAAVAPETRVDEVLAVHDLRKVYGDTPVVDGLSFSIRRGECYALLGPNGAGKTTTLRCCLGLTRPDGGSIRLVGEPVPREARRARIRVGVVPQVDNLDPDFTVTENLVVYGRYYGLRDSEVRERLPHLLDFASLTHKKDAPISELSGGMKRRLTLARSLVNDPDLIFMDEPTTGLDPQARHLIWERLKALLARGKTILLTTHFMDEAERLAHRLAVIDRGRMIAQGEPRELIREYIEPQVLEVYGEGAQRWAQQTGRALVSRIEVTGETVFCYASDSSGALQALERQPGLRYLHRPANLEDLFLKLTGREMRDEG